MFLPSELVRVILVVFVFVGIHGFVGYVHAEAEVVGVVTPARTDCKADLGTVTAFLAKGFRLSVKILLLTFRNNDNELASAGAENFVLAKMLL